MSDLNNKVDKFVKTWKKLIDDIKKCELGIDGREASIISLDFDGNKSLLLSEMKKDQLGDMDLRLLESELTVALAIAVTKFKLRNRGILARIFGGILSTWSPKVKVP